jgi:hypothetical protein
MDDTTSYTSSELPVIGACLLLFKTSKRCLKLTMLAGEAVGSMVDHAQAAGARDGSTGNTDPHLRNSQTLGQLRWIATLHDYARKVGVGVTDVGATLYPPLNIGDVELEAQRQIEAMARLLSFVLDATTIPPSQIVESDFNDGGGNMIDLPEEVMDLAVKIKSAIESQTVDLVGAINNYKENNEVG